MLSEVANADGYCHLPREDLLARAAALLEAPVEALPAALEALAREREVFAQEERVYLAPFFHAENGTARRLRLVMKAPNTLPRVTERQSGAEKPKVSVRRSRAPRTTERRFGSLEICRRRSKASTGAVRRLELGRWRGRRALIDARIRRRRPSLVKTRQLWEGA